MYYKSTQNCGTPWNKKKLSKLQLSNPNYFFTRSIYSAFLLSGKRFPKELTKIFYPLLKKIVIIKFIFQFSDQYLLFPVSSNLLNITEFNKLLVQLINFTLRKPQVWTPCPRYFVSVPQIICWKRRVGTCRLCQQMIGFRMKIFQKMNDQNLQSKRSFLFIQLWRQSDNLKVFNISLQRILK